MPANDPSEPHQQKRTRSEESLGDTPPAKVPSPAPAFRSLKESRVPTAAATPALMAPADPQPVTAAAQGHGAVLPAPVTSASEKSVPEVPPVSPSLAASSEWRNVVGGRVRKPPAEAGVHQAFGKAS
ncbi:Krueppel-like factor 13 [Eriocheir sinensis]|uniref:Krueppel-like factor 13 n=1 Tax=Eriocheir sinensis TaxID=95602 RepID=UPI0021C86F34|nr:Krueppel-like factor 13 [Eriocheir sinensis]